MNMHKPFLCSQICLISDYTGDYSWVENDLEKLEKYFECYEKNYYFENCGLYVWCDDIMIGMDNDPASFGRPKFSTANIFLNSFMVHELGCMAQILTQFGQTERLPSTAKRRRIWFLPFRQNAGISGISFSILWTWTSKPGNSTGSMRD